MEATQKRKLSLALILALFAVCAIVFLASSRSQPAQEVVGNEMAFMQVNEENEALANEEIGAPDEENWTTLDLAAEAQGYLNDNELKDAKTEEEARTILARQLKESEEDAGFLDDLVSEWKLAGAAVKPDSASPYYVNKGMTPRFGGPGGKPFVFYRRGRVIMQACVKSGGLIDAIRVQYSDRKWSPMRGGRGGRFHCTKVPGKCISSVFIKAGRVVDGILFGKTGGGISPYFGGYGGRGRAVSYNGGCLYKIVVRSGGLVDSLQFFFTKGRPPVLPRPKPKCNQPNVALRRPTGQSSIGWGGASARAVDGHLNGMYQAKSCTHTLKEAFPWFVVFIGRQNPVCAVRIFNRRDCCGARLNNFRIFVTNRQPKKGFRVRRNEICASYNSKKVLTTRSFSCRRPMRGQYVGVQIVGNQQQYLTLCEFQVFTIGRALPQPKCRGRTNVAFRRPTGQKSMGWGGASSRAVDGNRNQAYGGNSCTHTKLNENPWWYANIGNQKPVCRVQIFNRKDCCGTRLNNFKVFVTNRKPTKDFVANRGETCFFDNAKGPWLVKNIVCKRPMRGRYVGVQIVGKQYLTICEFKVFTV